MHGRGFVDRTRAVGVALAASLLFSTLLVAAPASATPALFETPGIVGGGSPGVPHGARGRAAVRQRQVTARAGLLTDPDGAPLLAIGDRVHLNLFDDASFSMTVTDVARHAGRGLTWSGTLDGVDLGYAVLAVHDGALVGQVVMPGAVYRIGYAADGTPVVEEVDQAALPPEGHPITPPATGDDATKLGDEVADEANDPASQIDVMVLYTAAARAAAGGTAAMRAEANLAVASANQAYANNGLVQRLRLVFAGEVSITESNFDADLDALKGHPTVGWLRDVSRADVVTLLTDHGPSPQFCGFGFLMTTSSASFARLAFNVVERVCAVSNQSFAHELGHNMGAHHDPYVAGLEPTVFPYSHGYVDLVGKFRTIMAYNDQCRDAGFSCTRIPFFSTPGLTHNGRLIGNAATSDNARTLGKTAGTVANFRQAATSPLTLSTDVSQPAFAVGEPLVAAVSVSNPGTAAGTADFYLGLLLPDGTVAFFTDVAITGTTGYAFGNVLNFDTYRPIATGVPLGSPFTASFPSVISYRRAGSDPTGGFAFFVLAVTSGALADGVLATNELLGASLSPFAFPAAAGGGCVGGVCKP